MWKLAILAAAAVLQPTATTVSASKWHIEDQHTQLDDTQSFTAALNSVNTLPDSVGSLESATLFVQCENGELDVYVAWPPDMGDQDRKVRWKLDSDAVTGETWTGSELGTQRLQRSPMNFLQDLPAQSIL